MFRLWKNNSRHLELNEGDSELKFMTSSLAAITLICGCTSPELDGRIDGSIRKEKIRAHLKILSDDIMEGRGPGSRGGDLAAHYIESQFVEAGLKPAVGDSGFFQPVHLSGIVPNPALSIWGNGKYWNIRYKTDFVAWTKIEEPQIVLRGKEVVFVGYGIDAPEFNWSDYDDSDFTGKVLLILVNEPQSSSENFFDGAALTYYGRWTYKLAEAARRGADGVILIHTTPLAGYEWNVVENSWTGEQFYVSTEGSDGHVLSLESWITEAIAIEILSAIGIQLADLLQKANSSAFKPIPIPLRVASTINNQIRHIETPNVIAKIEGSDPLLKRECVIYTSHYDHLGKNENLQGDQIFNGAFDNASGTAALLEVARAFSELPAKPARTILFAALTAEEAGTLGSKFYADNPVFPLFQTAANINIDAINVLGKTRDVVPIGADRSTIMATIVEVANEMQMEVSPDPLPEQGHFYRSDQISFARKGVPSVFLVNGLKYIGKPEGWGKKAADDYTKEKYHTVKDEYDDSWTLEGTEQMALFALKLGLKIANADTMPVWNKGEQFERARFQTQREKK